MRLMCILLGIIIWQLITTIVFFATNEDEEKTAMIGSGLPLLLLFCTLKFLKKIRHWYLNKTYDAYLICRENYQLPIEHVRIKKKHVHEYYCEGENNVFIKPSHWKPSSSIDVRKIRKNGWFDQEWVDKNLKKHI